MTIETHTLREELIVNVTADQLPYSNPRVGTLTTNIADAMDYLFASIYPNYIGTFATPAALPGSATANDYAFVSDDGDGKSAGYVYSIIDGVLGWNKRYDVDWSRDALLSSFLSETHPLYVFLAGRENGQTIYGGIATGENLEFNANSFDDTGKIVTKNTFEPKVDNSIDLGATAKRFKDIFLNGQITDGVISLSLTNLKDAFDHTSLTNNPHATTYNQLGSKPGTVTFDGDVSGTIDLSTSGNKTSTIAVSDDSHSHTKSTLTGFDTNVYTKAKAALQSGDGISFTANDGLETLTVAMPSVALSKVTNIALPAVNQVLASDSSGTNWAQTALTTTLTGDVTGTASFLSSTGGISLSTTVDHVLLKNVDGINLNSIIVAIATDVSDATVTMTAHGLVTGNKVRIDSSIIGVVVPTLNAEYTITVTGVNNFTIPVAVTVAGNANIIVNTAQLLFNSTTNKWEVNKVNANLNHSDLANLTLNDDHTNYVAIAGRSGGQTIQGGTGSLNDLVLESTTNATKGNVKVKDSFVPFTATSYSSSWSGIDLGTTTFRFRNIHTNGELIGARIENLTSTPSSSGQNLGRLIYNTVQDKLFYDNGTQFKPLSSANITTIIITMSNSTSYLVDLTSTLETDKTTSDYTWALYDSTTSQAFNPSIARTTTKSVTINSELPLTGTFALKGI